MKNYYFLATTVGSQDRLENALFPLQILQNVVLFPLLPKHLSDAI